MPGPEARPRRATEKDGDVTRLSSGIAVDNAKAFSGPGSKKREPLSLKVLYQARGVGDFTGRVMPRMESS